MHVASILIFSSVAILQTRTDAPAARKPTAAHSFRLYRTTDGGNSWAEVGAGLPRSQRINALATGGSVSFAGTDGGIFTSTDDGKTWSASPILPTPRIQCFAVADRRVYAGTARAGVFVTEDGGRAWRPVARGLTDMNVRSLATRGAAVFAGTDSKGVFVRSAGDEGWAPFGRGLPGNSQVFDLAVKGQHIYAALYSNGLFRIEAGGGGWDKVGTVTPLEFLAQGDSLVAGHNPGGIFRSIDAGTTWKRAGGLPGDPPIWVLGAAGSNLIAGTSPGAVAISRDRGESWKLGAAGIPPDAAVIAVGDGKDHTLAAVVVPGGG
jgi:photosystem II stability/assembly factor-like uncharacterized protein